MNKPLEFCKLVDVKQVEEIICQLKLRYMNPETLLNEVVIALQKKKAIGLNSITKFGVSRKTFKQAVLNLRDRKKLGYKKQTKMFVLYPEEEETEAQSETMKEKLLSRLTEEELESSMTGSIRGSDQISGIHRSRNSYEAKKPRDLERGPKEER